MENSQLQDGAPDSALRSWIRCVVLGLLALSTLPFGGARPAATAAIELCAACLGLLTIGLWLRDGIGFTRSCCRLAALAAFVLLFGAAQLVPLAPQLDRDTEVRALADLPARTWSAVSVSPVATLDALLRFAAYALLAAAAAASFRTAADLRQLGWTVVIVGTFQSFYGSVQYLSGHQHIFSYAKQYYTSEATGTFINRNHFACMLAMSLPFAVTLAAGLAGRVPRTRRLSLRSNEGVGFLFAVGAAAVIWVGILLSYSRSGMAVAVAALLLLLLRYPLHLPRYKILLPWLALVTVAAFWLNARTPGSRFADLGEDLASRGGRLAVWGASWRIVREHPLMGVGFGSFGSAFPQVQPESIQLGYSHAHNDYLQTLVEGGLPTLLAIVAIVVLTLAGLARAASSNLQAATLFAALGALALHSLVDFCVRIPSIAVLAAILVGAATAIGEAPVVHFDRIRASRRLRPVANG